MKTLYKGGWGVNQPKTKSTRLQWVAFGEGKDERNCLLVTFCRSLLVLPLGTLDDFLVNASSGLAIDANQPHVFTLMLCQTSF